MVLTTTLLSVHQHEDLVPVSISIDDARSRQGEPTFGWRRQGANATLTWALALGSYTHQARFGTVAKPAFAGKTRSSAPRPANAI